MLLVDASEERAKMGVDLPGADRETAKRWGVSEETMMRVRELASQVDDVYMSWANSRDRSGINASFRA